MLPSVVVKPNGVENKEYNTIFCTKMQELWATKKMLDITFQVDGLEIQAHQVVLAACSQQLCDALTQIQTNTSTRNVVMDLSRGGFKMTALKELLNYVYYGKMKVDFNTYHDIRKVANILQISQIVSVCDSYERSFFCKDEGTSPKAISKEAPLPEQLVKKLQVLRPVTKAPQASLEMRKPPDGKVNKTPVAIFFPNSNQKTIANDVAKEASSTQDQQKKISANSNDVFLASRRMIPKISLSVDSINSTTSSTFTRSSEASQHNVSELSVSSNKAVSGKNNESQIQTSLRCESVSKAPESILKNGRKTDHNSKVANGGIPLEAVPAKIRKQSCDEERPKARNADNIGSQDTGPVSGQVDTKFRRTKTIAGEDQTESYNFPQSTSSSDLCCASSVTKPPEAGYGYVSKVTVEIEGKEYTFEIEKIQDENESQSLEISETDSVQESGLLPTKDFSDVKVESPCCFDSDHLGIEREWQSFSNPNSCHSPAKISPSLDSGNCSEVTVKVEPVDNSFEAKNKDTRDDTVYSMDFNTCGSQVVQLSSQEDILQVPVKVELSETSFAENLASERKEANKSVYGQGLNINNSKGYQHSIEITEGDHNGPSFGIALQPELLPLEEIKQEPVDILEVKNDQFNESMVIEENDFQTCLMKEDFSKVKRAERSIFQQESGVESVLTDRLSPDKQIDATPTTVELCKINDQKTKTCSTLRKRVGRYTPPCCLKLCSVELCKISDQKTKTRNKPKKRVGRYKSFKKKGKKIKYKTRCSDPRAASPGKVIKVSFQNTPANDSCVDFAHSPFSMVGSKGRLGQPIASVSTHTPLSQAQDKVSQASSSNPHTESTPPRFPNSCNSSTEMKEEIDGNVSHPSDSDDNKVITYSSLVTTKRVKCVICKCSFLSISRCEQHVLNVHIALQFDDCPRAVELQKKAQAVMYLCSCCEYMTPNQKFIFIHRLYHHKVPINVSLITPCCHQCEIILPKDTDLEKHKLTHQNYYTCTICEKHFQQRANVLSHINSKHPTVNKSERFVRPVLLLENKDT